MLRGPRQPSSPGRINEHARQTAAHIQQRGVAGFGGAMTTKGFLPNRPKQIIQRGTTSEEIVAAPLNMVFRGEFNAGANYSPGDVFTVQNGDSGGAFVAAVPIPAGSVTDPSASDSIVQISSFTFGQWT